MAIQPYLFFQGRADEAIAFYEKALGAKRVMLMRFKDLSLIHISEPTRPY